MKNKLSSHHVYLNKVNENWIVDRTRKEWYENNQTVSTKYLFKSNVIWLIASWNWKKINKKHLSKKKTLCSIYHIDEEKFDNKEKALFFERDKFVDEYHVISQKTKIQVSKLTNKKITSIPFWVNKKIWFEINDKQKLFEKFKFNREEYFIGSFQRDSEGSNVLKPKLSKGPDRFLKIIKELNKTQNIHIVLTGRKRDYLINELTKNDIKFTYFEMASFQTINELYNCLDLYIVSSRYEGGPQAILECGVTKTPIVSTDVGVASEILAPESIFNMENFLQAKPNIEYAHTKASKFEMEKVFNLYNKMLKNLYEN
tara:strand:+ start:1958 stop:2899 length:942 start_codon:yes stop_codon:yes gene_type:complete